MKKISLDYTELEIYPSYLVARTREGVVVDLDRHLKVMEIAQSEIGSHYGFIIDEVNEYSVKFEVMLNMKRDPSLVCGAIVAYRNKTIKALACAVDFIGKPTRVFGSLDEARKWVKNYMDEHYPVARAEELV